MARSSATTLKDVARLVGVSIATVSAALNESGRVAPETRDRVLKAAQALNYSPSLAARGLQRSRTNVIGVLLGHLAPAQFEITVGINSGAIVRGRQLLISTTGVNVADEARRVRDLGGLTDGIVLISPLSSPDVLNSFESLGIPMVLANYRRAGTHLPVVYGDNIKASIELTEHLLALGHRRIAFVSGRHESGQSDERERGFRIAMSRAGVPVDDDLVLEGNFAEDSGVEAAHAVLRMGSTAPTAIFGVNDLVARGVMAGLFEAGFSVPQDFSVVGFDASPIVRTDPELTTVRHPFEQVGEEAARLLCALIDADPETRQSLVTSSIEFPSTLVVRASSAAPRSSGVKVHER